MEQEIQPAQPQAPIAPNEVTAPLVPDPEYRGLRWVFIGGQGLRAGLVGCDLFHPVRNFHDHAGTTATAIARHIPHVKTSNFTPATAAHRRGDSISGGAGSGCAGCAHGAPPHQWTTTCAARGPLFTFLAESWPASPRCRRWWERWSGAAAAFRSGGALRCAIYGYAAIWGVVFLLTGIVEEGSFRGFLQFTFTRGINFWWALARLAQPASYCFLLPAATASGAFISRPCWVCRRVYCCTLRKRRERPSGRRHGLLRRSLASSTPGNGGENWIGVWAGEPGKLGDIVVAVREVARSVRRRFSPSREHAAPGRWNGVDVEQDPDLLQLGSQQCQGIDSICARGAGATQNLDFRAGWGATLYPSEPVLNPAASRIELALATSYVGHVSAL